MFFVTGLPRSRTAWFSLYLDCEHEFLDGLRSKDDFYMQMPQYKGDSDCGLIMTDFQAMWPNAPTVVIRRDPEEVQESLALQGLRLPLGIIKEWDAKLDGLNGLHVPFDDINKRLKEITEYVGVDYDERRAMRYKSMRVELMKITGNAEFLEVWS